MFILPFALRRVEPVSDLAQEISRFRTNSRRRDEMWKQKDLELTSAHENTGHN